LLADPVPPSRATLSESAAARVRRPPKAGAAAQGRSRHHRNQSPAQIPAERYATANAFGEDIARYLRGDVVLPNETVSPIAP
jgi:hypothetical protein